MARASNRRGAPGNVDWGRKWRNDRQSTDQVIGALIALNVLVFVGWQTFDLRPFMAQHFLVSADAVAEYRVWTLLTSEFSHADATHLIFNMFGLWVFGRAIGQVRGASEVLRLYLFGAVIASAAHVLFLLFSGDNTPALGASGAVMAMAAYYGGMFPDRTLLVGFILPLPAAAAVALFILIDVFGLAILQDKSPIAHAAHLGGAAFGLLYYQFGVERRR